MRVDAFVAGYTGGSTVYQNRGQFVNGAGYFTDRDVHNNVLTAEEYSTKMDVYKEEALRRLMSPVLYNLTAGVDGSISYEQKQLSRDEVLALRAADLKGVKINWAPLNIQLANRLPNHTNMDHVGYDIDYFASEYVQYKHRIMESLTGDEQAEELQKLESMMKTHVEKYAEQFSEIAGHFLHQYGVSGEKEAIKDSIIELFELRVAQYTEFIQENDNYAGVRGTADEWLLFDNSFMGEQLRYAFASRGAGWETTVEGGYGIDDLAALGALVKETWNAGYQSWRWGFVNRHKSEEEFGVELGLTAMKYALISETYNISSSVKSKLDAAFQNFIKAQNENARNYIVQMRNDPFVREKASYAADWNEEIVLDIVSRMLENFNSNDLNRAFQEDMFFILQLYKDRTESRQTGNLARYHPYHNTWFKSPYVGDWNQFVRRLSLSSGQELSRYILQDSIAMLNLRG